ncbi:hypothetical protein AMJ82_08195 [candidate division TA06 bacterium SM23_40]|uniref:FlgD Ig-like domain-containing protein n=1 Tax=candidate division TA06 bacterium SM23_40 TaxID=1703774 RepID=A0A0S8G615_UNCT6|nr:MAG: hypothetical protein AMJ82_08195 [candidate division TA06 bacterium SM23_40]
MTTGNEMHGNSEGDEGREGRAIRKTTGKATGRMIGKTKGKSTRKTTGKAGAKTTGKARKTMGKAIGSTLIGWRPVGVRRLAAILPLTVMTVICSGTNRGAAQFLFYPPVVIDPDPAAQSAPSVAVDSQGNPCLVYDFVGEIGSAAGNVAAMRESSPLEGEEGALLRGSSLIPDRVRSRDRYSVGIRFTRSTDGGLTFPVSTWVDSSNTVCAPRMAIDDEDNVHIVYAFDRDGDRVRYVRSTDGGISFLPGVFIPPRDAVQRSPDIALDPSGNPFVVWHDGADIYVSRSTDRGENFLMPVGIGDPVLIDCMPSIASDTEGNPHVAWTQQHMTPVTRFCLVYARSTDGGQTFLDPCEIDPGPGDRSSPRVAIDRTGNPVIVWTDARTRSPYLAGSTDCGATFPPGRCVGTDRVWGTGGSIAFDAANHPVVAWREERGPFSNICVTRSTDAGVTFLPGVLVDSIDALQVNTSLTLGTDCGPMVVWEDARPVAPFDTDIYFAGGYPIEYALGTLAGRVRDERTGGGIAALLVARRDGWCAPPDSIRSDSTSGEFTLDLMPGTYDIEVQPGAPYPGTAYNGVVIAPDSITQLEVLVSPADVVLIDDDGGEGYEILYIEPLDQLGIRHCIWCVATDGTFPISCSTLLPVPTIIWFTGDQENETLTEADQESLRTFLGGEGRLLLSGQFIAEDIGDTPFYHDWLCAGFDTVSSERGMYGEPGDTIGDGLTVAIAGANGADNQVSPDEIHPENGARVVFRYPSGAPSALRTDHDGGRVVYCAFGVEAVSKNGPAQATRGEVISRVLDWFGVSTAVGEEGDEDREVALDLIEWSVHPNPCQGASSIVYDLGAPLRVEIRIFNLLGQQVRRLIDRTDTAGRHCIRWGGENERGDAVASGVYLVYLTVEGGGESARESGKIVLLR